MALDPSIFNNVGAGVQPLLNPLDMQARKIAIRNALAAGTLQQQQIDGGALALQNQRQAYTDDQRTRAAIRDIYAPPAANALAGGVPPAPAPPSGALPFSADAGLSSAPTGGAAPAAPAPAAPETPPARPAVPTMSDLLGRGVPYSHAAALIESFQKVDKTSSEIDQARAAAAKSNQEIADLVRQQGAEMADAVIKATPAGQPINADLLNWHLQHFGSLGSAEAVQAQQVGAQLARLAPPDQITFLKSLSNTPKQLEANAKASDAARGDAEFDLKRPGMVTNQNGLTPEQASNAELRAREIDKLNTPAELALIASKPGPQQASARQALDLLKSINISERQASVQAPVIITPEGYQQLSSTYQTTGQLPTIPRGPGAQIAANVINGTAAANPTFNSGVARADYKANVGSLDAMQKQRDAVVTFERTAKANLDQFVSLAAKLPDLGSPILNAPLRKLNDKALGNDWAPAIQAARQIAVNEIAKVTSNPTLSGALSDSARHEVGEYNPADATLKQTLHVADVLRRDMANRRKYFDEGISEIKGRIAGGSASGAPAGANTGLQHKSTDELLQMLGNGGK